MTSQYIGVIYEKETKEIRAVINPAYDWQLEDPAHTTSIEEERAMLKLRRNGFPITAGPGNVAEVVEYAQKILKEL